MTIAAPDAHARRRELARLRSTRSRLGNRMAWAVRTRDRVERRIAVLTAELAEIDRQEEALLAAEGEAEA
ncbi:MAG TPA: hypothetical protein VLM76_11295 [Patescibacteria group bacterium]|nr:hypothetical protein [Patescibacteria group bacterium]